MEGSQRAQVNPLRKSPSLKYKLLQHSVVPDVFHKGYLRGHSFKEEQLSKSPQQLQDKRQQSLATTVQGTMKLNDQCAVV